AGFADLVGDELLVLLDGRIVIAAADQALHRENGFLWIGHRLPLGRLAGEALAVIAEGDNRRRGARAFGIFDHFRRFAVHHRNARIRRAKVDADHFTHRQNPFYPAGRPDLFSVRVLQEPPAPLLAFRPPILRDSPLSELRGDI